jgi:hypothetical protein
MAPPAATQAAARLRTQSTPAFPARLSYRSSVEITRTLRWQTRFTRGRVREWKSGHNSIFYHKDLGNHLLQLCPKVVKHPVCVLRIGCWITEAARIKADIGDTVREVEMLKSPRCIKTHLPLQLLPAQLWTVRPKVNILVSTQAVPKHLMI